MRAVTMFCGHARRLTGLIAVGLLLACAVAFAPGAAATSDKTVGARINLLGGAFQTFPAGQPFHLNHGWSLAPSSDAALGLWGFSLAVDGIEVTQDFVETTTAQLPGFVVLVNRDWVYNFENGMTGTHTFTGVFSGPCEGMVAGGFAAGPCDQKNAIVTTAPSTITVTFGP